ncbi:hypothetical protein [Sorangium sp. So ce394]|uniref:hypothetical protein n=1 Tax=Sorangium sp. So ce394 TaxID=3133310 RepID=UPI003F5B84DC
MANLRVLSWNIQVYGPTKYALTPNKVAVAKFVSHTIQESNANIVVLMELSYSVAPQIAEAIELDIEAATGQAWDTYVTPARPASDTESYAILWRTDASVNFQAIAGAAGLSTLDFPNNFSAINGRRAAHNVFRTTDTASNFAVSVYHAPPNNQAVLGVQQLAATPALYAVTRHGAPEDVDRRALCGDYNMDAQVDALYFQPLTNPLPAAPPPNVGAGEGSGCAAALPGGALNQSTLLGTFEDAVAAWGRYILSWAHTSVNYRRPNATIDNVYYRAAGFNDAHPIDCIDAIRNPARGSQLRTIANEFVLAYPSGAKAFTKACEFTPVMSTALNTMGYAFLLYRYAISDHLPVIADITI